MNCFWLKAEQRVALVLLVAIVATLVMSQAEAAEAFPRSGLVVQDAPLRGAPREAAPVQAQLSRGEALELRGERGDHWQVWDYQRERGGWLRKGQVLLLPRGEGASTELLSQLRLARQQWGTEGLGLGLAAAYVQVATPAELAGTGGAEALDAMGSFAERMADRASTAAAAQPGRPTDTLLAGQMDVAARYGLRFVQIEAEEGRVQVCYDGEAFRRVLGLPGATPEQRLRAALALTRPECGNARGTPKEIEAHDQWRADVLAQLDAAELPTHLKNRLVMRRASVAASLAFAQVRRGQPGERAAAALGELARVQPTELTEDDQSAYSDAAMRVNAVRWLALPSTAPSLGALSLTATPGAAGETCVSLRDARAQLAQRCSYGLVALASASVNREGNALALAVQPLDGWRELWVFVKSREGWRIEVLPPAAAAPGLGVAEFAGWVPGGQQMLVARESRAEGKYRRAFEVVSLSSLQPERHSSEAKALGAFQRWSDAAWVGASPIRR